MPRCPAIDKESSNKLWQQALNTGKQQTGKYNTSLYILINIAVETLIQ